MKTILLAAMLAGAPAAAGATETEGDVRVDARIPARAPKLAGIPRQLDDTQTTAYRAVFASIRAERWADAQLQLDAMPPGPLHPVARAELYIARGSPRVELAPLMAVLADAPELPQAPQLARLAQVRGATALPPLPTQQRLVWFDAAPTRARAKAVRSDIVSAELATAMKPFVKVDDGAGAEALLDSRVAELTSEAQTEWRQRVAWIYFIGGDDTNARRLARMAQAGGGEWAAQADWTTGLAAWRQNDCAAAQAAFSTVAQRAADTELRSAGLFWASRADIACGRPDLVQGRLNSAAQYSETYYGMLARAALGLADPVQGAGTDNVTVDWRTLERRPNIRVAAALVEVGEHGLAETVLRHQAKIGDAAEYQPLTRLAGRLNLPATQLWLSHNGPAGARPVLDARYPEPDWAPDGGWRVDRSLVFAHALQESKFNAGVVSPAGAFGLMQIMPAAANDFGRSHGTTLDRSALAKPSINMEIGQSYLEKLRDMSVTGGLLPKVIAAYNAGPVPVEAWNMRSRDGGDPLLYIETIPYWETRGYVMTVLRNYWMYERKAGKPSASRAALAQGMWPRFPGMRGDAAVRMSRAGQGNMMKGRVANAN